MSKLIKKVIMALAVAIGLTTAASAYNNDWTSLCKDATTYPKTGLAAMHYAGSQRGIAAEVTIAESATSTAYTIFDYGNGDNRVQLLITSAGKYQLLVNNGMAGGTKFDETSTADVTAGRHVFATLIRRGVSGGGHVISVIVYLDGAELFKVGDGSTSFVTGPFRNMACGTSGSANTISVSLWSATESAGTNDTDPTKIANIVADANALYPAPKVYTATVDSNKKWSDITWSEEIENPSVAALELTVTGTATITMDDCYAYGSVKIIGDATFVAADDLYEDGCWQKTLLGGTFTATGTISFGALKSGFAGAYAQTAKGITLRAQNKEVISINIAGGRDGGSGGDSPKDNLVSGSDFYGIAPTLGDSWNNINRQWQDGGNQTIKIEGPNAYDGTQVIKRETMSLSATGKNTWQCGSISNPFLRGYLDDGNGVTVEVHGIPYTEYDVIVYSTSDSSTLLAPVTINGTQYTFADGVTKPGATVWGEGQYATPEIGKNALRVNDCTGDTLTINAKRASSPDGRATLCAVQVINKGEVVLRETYEATIKTSTAFEEIDWGKTFTEGQLNEATITVDDSSTDEVEISFANSEMCLGKLEIISGRDVKLTADAPFENVGQFITTGCTAKVTHNYPVKSLTMTTDGLIGYTGGAGTDEKAASITFVEGGDLTLDGRDGEAAAYFIGDTFQENTKPYTMTFTNAQVVCKSWAGLAIGMGDVTIAGNSQVEAGKCILAQGTVGQVSEITIKDNSSVTITGENDVDSNQASIMFGHWDGSSTFTLQDNATFTAEKTQVLVGKTGNDHTINLNGGTFTTKGIKASASATGTNTLNLNGGSLVLGEVGISSYGTTTINVNVTEDSMITSTADMTITQPFMVAAGKSLTLDASAGDITLMKATGLTPDDVTVMSGNVYYGFTVGINDLGEFPIPEGYTASQIKLFDQAGNSVEFVENAGVLEFEWKYTGGACWWDYEFNEASGQTPKGTGSDTTGLNLDGDRSQAMKDAGEYATNIVETIEGTVTNIALRVPNRPWRDVGTWPAEATFMFYGTMVGKDKAYQIAFGSKNGSNNNQLFFATESVADGTVDLCYSVAGAAPTVLCTMNVPNAQKANHLYAVVLKDDGNGNTVVNTYLDGKLLQPYTHTGTLTLGKGFQIASGHGGPAAGGYGRPADDDPATMDWLRVYDVELNAKAMERLADIYPYVSENGKATRTVTSVDAAWVADDTWTQVTTEGSVTTNAPFANTMVEVTVNEDATLALNLAEKANYEALEIKGDGALTLTGAEDAVVPAVSGVTTIGTDVTVAYDAITFGNVTIADGKTLTFDFEDLDLSKEFKSRSIKLTGVAILGEESQVTVANVSESAGRTTELVYDTHTQQYSLQITVEDLPFVYNDGWTWAGETVEESVVDAHTEVLIEVQGGELEKAIDRAYLVTGGTLKAASYSGTPTITVQGGAFDVNGKKDAAYNVVLAGGKLMNGSTAIGTGSKQFTSISVTADSEVGGTGEFGYILQGWGANTLDLNGATLTKVDANTFSLCNCTVTNGTIAVTGGTLGIANTAVTFTDDAILTIGANGTLNLGTKLTIASIEAAEGATVNVNGQRGLAFTGSGTIVATLTDDEYEAGAVDVFTGTGTLKVMYNDEDITSKCAISGGSITAITKTITFTVAAPENASVTTVATNGVALTTPYKVLPDTVVTVTYTANAGYLFANGTNTMDAEITVSEAGEQPAPQGTETTAAEAKIGDVYYLTLNAANDAAKDGDTIELVKDAEGDGIFVLKNVTFDFGGFTYTLAGTPVGSTGYETQGFHIEAANCTLTNGTINCSAENKDKTWAEGATLAEKGIAMLVQNYSSLTVADMTLDGTNLAKAYYGKGEARKPGANYTLSNCSGTTTIAGSTISARDGESFAFDSDKTAVVTLTSGTINGKIEVYASLTIDGGTINGPTNGKDFDGKAVITVNGGTLAFNAGTLKATGVGDSGMYGVYVLNGGKATFGTQESGPSIEAWFAAIGANNTTPGTGVTITVNNGTYTQQAEGTDQWWDYFCSAIYAPAKGTYTIKGGTFNGTVGSIALPYNNVGQVVRIEGGTFAKTLYVGEKTASEGLGERLVWKGEGVTLAAPTGYEWDEEGYLVKKSPIEPVVPGEPIVTETPEQAVDIANDINTNAVLKAAMLKAPEGSGLEGTGLAAYQLCFTAVANGTAVTFELNSLGTNAVVIATDAAKTDALDVALSEESTLTIAEPLAGFYYSLKQGGDVQNLGFNAEGDQNKLATSEGVSFDLVKPEGAGFYQMIITPTPTKVEQ